jgi:hypothetical protein
LTARRVFIVAGLQGVIAVAIQPIPAKSLPYGRNFPSALCTEAFELVSKKRQQWQAWNQEPPQLPFLRPQKYGCICATNADRNTIRFISRLFVGQLPWPDCRNLRGSESNLISEGVCTGRIRRPRSCNRTVIGIFFGTRHTRPRELQSNRHPSLNEE